MSHILHDDDNDDAKAIAIHRVFSENSRAKKSMFILRAYIMTLIYNI